MAETLLSIQESAAITGKSIQTIRRAIKSRKLQTKRKKTPQGFNYMVTQESLTAYYKLDHKTFNRERGSLDRAEKNLTKAISTEFATRDDLQSMHETVEHLLNEYKKEKDSFMRFAKAFQDRFVVMENQLKVLEEPKKKGWFKLW